MSDGGHVSKGVAMGSRRQLGGLNRPSQQPCIEGSAAGEEAVRGTIRGREAGVAVTVAATFV